MSLACSSLPFPPGKSISLTEEAEAVTLASDFCAWQLSPWTPALSLLPFALSFLPSHTGLFTASSQTNQEHSHLWLSHWLFPLCLSSTFFKSWLTCNSLMTLPLIALFRIPTGLPTRSVWLVLSSCFTVSFPIMCHIQT